NGLRAGGGLRTAHGDRAAGTSRAGRGRAGSAGRDRQDRRCGPDQARGATRELQEAPTAKTPLDHGRASSPATGRVTELSAPLDLRPVGTIQGVVHLGGAVCSQTVLSTEGAEDAHTGSPAPATAGRPEPGV